MNIIYFSNIIFVLLHVNEFKNLVFKKKRNKWIWLILAFLFGYFGYFFFLIFKRKLVLKRKFNISKFGAN